MIILQVSLVAFSVISAIADDDYKNPHFLPGHEVIVHLMDWKWQDIAAECKRFLGPRGFGGIKVSPVLENVVLPTRPWYERYQLVSYKLITRSGNETEFRHMVRQCNEAGVRIYVDTVVDYMAGDQDFPIVGVAGSRAYPKIRSYPEVPYTDEDFHESCAVRDMNDPVQLRTCEMSPGNLPDLNQSLEHVRGKIVDMWNLLIDAGVAGLRIDAARRMWPHNIQIMLARTNNLNTEHGFAKGSRPFVYQEMIDLTEGGTWKNQYTFACVLEFKLSVTLSQALIGNYSLSKFGTREPYQGLLDSTDAIVFVCNHDSQRGQLGDLPVLNYKRPRLYKIATAFLLAHEYGKPAIMSSFFFDTYMQGPPQDDQENILSPIILDDGSCGNGWVCEHRWRQIYNMVRFRSVVNGTKMAGWWDNGHNQVAFARGDAAFIVINAEQTDLRISLRTLLPPGIYCDVISGDLEGGKCTGKSVLIDENGNGYFEILHDEEDGVIAIHKNAKLTK